MTMANELVAENTDNLSQELVIVLHVSLGEWVGISYFVCSCRAGRNTNLGCQLPLYLYELVKPKKLFSLLKYLRGD